MAFRVLQLFRRGSLRQDPGAVVSVILLQTTHGNFRLSGRQNQAKSKSWQTWGAEGRSRVGSAR